MSMPFDIVEEGNGVVIKVSERINGVEQAQQLFETLTICSGDSISMTLSAVMAHDYMLVQILALMRNEKKNIILHWSDHAPTEPMASIIQKLTLIQ